MDISSLNINVTKKLFPIFLNMKHFKIILINICLKLLKFTRAKSLINLFFNGIFLIKMDIL
jgi:hypothetical protein